MKRSHFINCFVATKSSAVPVTVLHQSDYSEWFEIQPPKTQQWVKNSAFEPQKGTVLAIPGDSGNIAHVIVGLINDQDVWVLARVASVVPTGLPSGTYEILDQPFYKNHACMQSPLLYLAWGLEQYRFTVYKPKMSESLRYKSLVVADSEQREFLNRMLSSIYFVRDLINTPAQDMNPITLEEVTKKLAEKHKAVFHSIVGDELLKQNFPAIHAVGRASVFEPRLLEFHWGAPDAPLVTLVGKGVCFDTGGLDLKPAAGMLLMKKDMSGSAQVLGLASLIMEMNLPIRLRVLIPAVENAVAGNAYHPGDVITTRKGLSVVINNTDAEGRVILCDALAYAMESPPELLVDIASLTGAAIMSLGYDIASFFTNDKQFSSELMNAAERVNESIWPMPLHAAYKEFIMPETADLTNACLLSFAGSITAALYLQEFAQAEESSHTTWVHFDTAGWSERAQPGKPLGGEATVIRTLFDYLANRFQN